jgi:hypothetical protein
MLVPIRFLGTTKDTTDAILATSPCFGSLTVLVVRYAISCF